MRVFWIIVVLLVVLFGAWWLGMEKVEAPASESEPATEESLETTTLDSDLAEYIDSKAELITVSSPAPGASVASPLSISRQARGYWFFEASFPVVLTDWDGKIIAEHYATAAGEWMTEEFVPFSTTIDFVSPYHDGDPEFMSRGTIILKRDNPSGLPENDDALEIPISYVAQP